MHAFLKLLLTFLLLTAKLIAQESEIDRLIQNEFKMTFPSIYFKHNSTDYASMPYPFDSCFKYIALHFDENLNSLVIWRDTVETERLSTQRIKKLRSALKKHLRNKEFEIYTMGQEQKVSRHTIRMTSDSSKINYLLTLNSVFDISKTHLPFITKESHVLHPKFFCKNCWKNGFHLNKQGREARKVARRKKRNEKSPEKKKKRRRLVWTGWKTGFHWSTAG